MCKDHDHCGWGKYLEKYWHTVLCCLQPHANAGLLVNHVTWTHDTESQAHAVGTWLEYAGDGRTWYVDVEAKTIRGVGTLCTLSIGIHNFKGPHFPVFIHHIHQDLTHKLVLDRSLDVILKEEI